MFYSTSKSSSSDNRVAASDQARALGMGAGFIEGSPFGDHNISFGSGSVATAPLASAGGDGGGLSVIFWLGLAGVALWIVWGLVRGKDRNMATVSGSNYSSATETINTDNTTTIGPGSLLLKEGSELNTGLQLGSVAGNVTFEGGIDDLKAAFSETLEAVKGLGESSSKAVAESTEQSTTLVNEVLEKVLGSIAGLAEGKQTDGESTMLKPVLIFLGVAVAVIGLALYFTKR